MKKLIIIFFVIFSAAAQAQITKVNIQASGLTCSMCSNAINKALKTLPEVKQVTANIKNSSFDIEFNDNAAVDFDKFKSKVEDAGFFVAKFLITLQADNLSVNNDTHTTLGNYTFHFVNVKTQTLNGSHTIRLLDKGFVPAKEFKKNSSFTKMPCYSTGAENGKRIFHVTI